METVQKSKWVTRVLFSNGVVDLLAALALFFPVFKLPLPGYSVSTPQLAFVAGGWGIAALTLGIGRIWASYRPPFYYMMVILGLIEGCILTLFCLVNVAFLGVTWLQALLPLLVGSIFGLLYLTALTSFSRVEKPGSPGGVTMEGRK